MFVYIINIYFDIYIYLVTADVVCLYPSIPHNADLEALKAVLDKRENHSIPTEKLVKMAEFVLKNNFFWI